MLEAGIDVVLTFGRLVIGVVKEGSVAFVIEVVFS